MNLTIGRNIKKETLQEKYGPLRKIVREFTTYDKGVDGAKYPHVYEELECGHIVAPKRDIYGVTNAYRRRCWKCKQSGCRTMLAPDKGQAG